MTTPPTPSALQAAWLLLSVRWTLARRGLNPLLNPLVPVPEAAAETTGAPPEARRIGQLVASTAARIPGTRRCLVQALAASILLRRRRLPHQLVLGARPEDGSLKAHAWIVSRGEIIVGDGPMASLPRLAVFASSDGDRDRAA